MTYENYRLICLIALIACGVCLALSIALFFLLKIPKTISDLTGRTARKAIEDIRMQNELSGDKSYQSSAVNLQRGKLTDKITKSGRLQARASTPFGTGIITEKISTQQLAPEDMAGATELLGGNDTEVLGTPGGETAVLQQPEVVQASGTAFTVEYEITYIHTNEVIS